MHRVKPPKIIKEGDRQIIDWVRRDSGKGTYSAGRNYIDGSKSVYFNFKYGDIELIGDKVIGGNVCYPWNNTVIDVDIVGNELVVSRFTGQLENSKGIIRNTGRLFATNSQLYSVKARKFAYEEDVLNILNKDYKEYPHVADFMALAREIYAREDRSKQFDRHD